MPFIPAVNTAKVTFLQRLANQLVSNTIFVQKTEPWEESDLTSLATACEAWWRLTLAPILSSGIGLTAVQARSMEEESAPGVEVPAGLGAIGGVPTAASPGNVAVAVKILTGLTGRNHRGRNFIAGIPEADTADNQISNAFHDALQAAYFELLGDLTGLNWEWVIASFYNTTQLLLQSNGETRRVPVPRPLGGLLTPVTSFVVNRDLDSQRRRLNGRGI